MTSAPTRQNLSLFALTAMVFGSMVGSGILSLPRTFGLATGPFGAIIASFIAGGANALIGGSRRTITLLPLSVEGQIGLNLAWSVKNLTLR